MPRRALQKFPAPDFADEFSVASGHFAAHGDNARAAFDFPAFKRVVIAIDVLCLRGNFAAIFGVENDEVGIRARLDGALAREQIECFRHLRAGAIDEGMQIDFACLHAVGIKHVDAIFE